MQRFIFTALVCACAISCEQEAKSVQEILSYCNDPIHGTHKVIEQGDFKLEIIYRPLELIVAQEINGLSLLPKQIDSVYSLFKGFDYFLLRIGKRGHEIETYYAHDRVKFSQVNNYLAFKIGEDIKLIHKTDTLNTKGVIHTRTFGSSSSTDLLIAFESSLPKRKGSVQLIFNDTMFDTGLHISEFNTSDIRSIPSLDLTKHL
jgi:hypothetical protein